MTVRITWWGHATVSIELGGVSLLTDPLLTSHLAHLHRIGSPVPPRSAGDVDGVLVSHLHADHLHLPSLRRVRSTAELVVPTGARGLLGSCPQPVHEVDVAAEVDVHGLRVQAVRAEHDGRRLPGSRYHGPALGYVISDGSTRVWFAGDTGVFDAIADIGPVDVAVLPVGGWGPTLGPHHLDPDQAAEVAARVGARHAVPVHFGTFWPVGLRRMAPHTFAHKFTEPGRRFADAARDRAPGTQVHVLACGEAVTVDA